jgi:hypothetical protein
LLLYWGYFVTFTKVLTMLKFSYCKDTEDYRNSPVIMCICL